MSGIVLAAEEIAGYTLLCTEEEGSSIEVHVCFQRLGVDVRGCLGRYIMVAFYGHSSCILHRWENLVKETQEIVFSIVHLDSTYNAFSLSQRGVVLLVGPVLPLFRHMFHSTGDIALLAEETALRFTHKPPLHAMLEDRNLPASHLS